MPAKVYFKEKFDIDSIRTIAEKILADISINKEDKIALKVHFGEKGNTRFVKPDQINPIVEKILKINKSLFVTDTNTLYRGMRTNAKDHIKLANEHGFGSLGIPIVIADGELGADEEDISVDLKHFKTVKIGKAIAESDVLIFINHFKGHVLFGFGGAIKNLSMGTGSRAGKLAMHSKIMPSVNDSGCIGCKVCEGYCDVNSIIVDESTKKATISDDCIGCAKCISVCPQDAIMVPWGGAIPNDAMERAAEYALGASKGKKCLFITFINNISKDCDCMTDTEIIGKDVGIIASTDPVAADQAAYDLVKDKHGKDIFKDIGGNAQHLMDYSENIGLGTKEYDLVIID